MNALMQAPPFPTNPSVGEFYGNFVWNGRQWVCSPAAGVRVVCQVFNASGPYMPSQGLVTAVVECFGGGGGGGAVIANLTAGFVVSGAGGGSGGYSRKALAASLVAGGVQVTIGAGGASNTNGSPTSFGALCVANGGFGANVLNTQFAGISAGHGALPGVGDIAMPGATGENGVYILMGTGGTTALASSIGGSLLGGSNTGEGGPGTFSNGPDSYANSGAGGGGAIVNNAPGHPEQFGGAGGSGLCVVTEYCWADTAPDGDCTNPPLNVNARVAVTHVPWQGPGPCPPGWGGRDGALEFEGD